MPWFTDTAEAASLISVDDALITDENLAHASLLVETFINREAEDIPSINLRDMRRIQKAMAWQAWFLKDQEGYSYNVLIESTNTDGQQFNMVKGGGGGVDIAAQLLSPVVIRILRNVSWIRNPYGPERVTARDIINNFTSESSDSKHSWEPLV